MSTDGYLTSTDIRAGWMRGPHGEPRPVLYANVDGWAVFEGCVIIGKTEDMQAVADAIAKNPEALAGKLLGLTIADPNQKWPKVGDFYEVRYEVDPNLPEPDRVKQAFAHWEEKTKIRFKPRGNAKDWVSIVPGNGCMSQIGKQGEQQHIWLAANCQAGNVIHEIGHTVGLWHEHSRPDRDDYVEVIWDNILTQAQPNFAVQTFNREQVGPYDFGSIMHYPDWAFSNNQKPTIRAKKNGAPAFGQRIGLSAGDIAAVASLYP